jgi:hypothetical protein
MNDYDKMGVFYLGKILHPPETKPSDEPLLYDSKNLTTHAVCLGMTGSGKTGLGIALLEEAGLDKIPAIIIDPKGDMSNLLLSFPNLSAEEFLPWIDPNEAKNTEPSVYAEQLAKTWKEGLESFDEDPERIAKLRGNVEMEIYTPANSAGKTISILSSFSAPSEELIKDDGAFRDRVMALVSSLLGLLGINADPLKSREHILLSTIIDHAWRKGNNLDIAELIQNIQKPAFKKIGALELETFYPQKDRMTLSINLNNFLAAPGFKAWMEGEPLDVKKLLHTSSGKPKFSIFSIAHLSESERMFFVTLLLNEIIVWMRRQSGTSSLKALLYMDEIFGYFPPTAMPPSKTAMLTLLKQARAYGLGIVLATQNPVDLDYKGLSNCGTWFIGKLQTERDIARVTEGLSIASNGELDSQSIKKLLASVKKRVFVMRSVYEKEPITFYTRWTLSYLYGPLTLNQIQTLTGKTEPVQIPKQAVEDTAETKPSVPSEIPELFLNKDLTKESFSYSPNILGMGKLHFVDSKKQIDMWQDFCLIAPVDDNGNSVLWEEAITELQKPFLQNKPIPKGHFEELPQGLLVSKNYANFQKSLAAHLYQNEELTIYQAPELGLISKENESEGDFKARITLALREKRDEMVAKLREKYAEKIDFYTKKLKIAQEKASQKQQQSMLQKIETFISFLTTLVGAFFGRGISKTTISQAGTSARRASKIGLESQKAAQAEADYQECQKNLDELHEEMRREIDGIYTTNDTDTIKIETFGIHPRKGDTDIEKLALVWLQK